MQSQTSSFIMASFLVLLQLTTTSLMITQISAFAVHEVLAPNMSSCHLPSDLPIGEEPFNCCAPPAHYAPRLFIPNSSSSSSVLRIRRPAHTADHAYAEKLARAYALMKALPADDPRSFMQQANIHCAYCNKVYNQMNSSQLFQVHGSWLFFPFHRWYLYFHERILGKLLREETFALPFWNYDHPDGATIPWLYSSYNLTLVDPLRDSHQHAASAIAAIDFAWDTDNRSRETQLRENDNAMFRALIRDASSQKDFFGAPYRKDDLQSVLFGSVEKGPHNFIHSWVGQKSQIGWKDMGSFYGAARDPLFYAHHSELDRFWEVWKSMLNHTDCQDVDYLDTEFAFYNEDAELVRVKVRDALDTTNLGYVYREMESPWMKATPVRWSTGTVVLLANDTLCIEGKPILEPCSIVIERNVNMGKSSHVLGEYMVFTYEYAPSKLSHIDIYINLPTANSKTDTGCEEYFTFCLVIPPFENTTLNVTRKVFRSDMSERLAALNLTQESSVVVTMVPRGIQTLESATISILNFSIEYASHLGSVNTLMASPFTSLEGQCVDIDSCLLTSNT